MVAPMLGPLIVLLPAALAAQVTFERTYGGASTEGTPKEAQ